MAFNLKRRLILAAIIGGIPVVLFSIAAPFADRGSRAIVVLAGLALGAVLFGLIALSRPAKDDE